MNTEDKLVSKPKLKASDLKNMSLMELEML